MGSSDFPVSSNVHNYSLASGFTKTLSSSLLTDFRFGYFKYNPQTQKPDTGTPMTAFGIPNANTSDPKTAGLGAFLLGSDPISGQGCTTNNGQSGCVISSFGDGLGVARCNCPLTESEQQFQFVNNWTKITGNHQFKFGADIRYAMNLRIPSDNNRTGEYNFSPEATRASKPAAGGLDLATFLFGDVTSFARYVNNPNLPWPMMPRSARWRTFFYGQDTWRASSKLTLNYGLRWEIYFPEYVNAKGNGGFANLIDLGGTGAIRVGGYGPYGLNGNIGNDFKAFAPRLGVAYQVNPKTVVRAGYGRSLRYRRLRFQLRPYRNPEPAGSSETKHRCKCHYSRSFREHCPALRARQRTNRASIPCNSGERTDSFLLTKSGYRKLRAELARWRAGPGHCTFVLSGKHCRPWTRGTFHCRARLPILCRLLLRMWVARERTGSPVMARTTM